ncbi:hypothetical protein ACHAW5_008203 [Stephanodiscus triporus]|uniref:PinX1-related protein 1 n=1 Tax=Stephanodiscus triporus TaxID=2934178 RepID=A0ABD3MRF6_9STRA
MTIVAKAETRNSQWANDHTSFGRKMLAKMGWKGDGCGLGKEQQGSSVHLRAMRRVESLGIGAENDAFGDRGWHETNAGFHGVLASLKREYGKSSSSSSRVGDDGGGDEEGRRKTEGRKRRKREEDGATIKNKKRGRVDGGNDDGGGGVRLPQNKVQAGHARKMREAKDIRSKSAEDMAAIFGVRADQYKQQYMSFVVDDDDGRLGAGDANSSSSDAADERGEKSRKEKKRKNDKNEKEETGESKVTVEDEACGETDGKSNEAGRGEDEKKKKKKKKKEKKEKKRRRSSEVEAKGDSSDDHKRRKKDKSRK